MQLHLDDHEAHLLREVLRSYLKELRGEIVDTDNVEYKRTLRHERECGRIRTEPEGVSCTGTVPGLGATTAVFKTEEGATTVSFGASAGPTLGLPAGLTIGGCCVNPCCSP